MWDGFAWRGGYGVNQEFGPANKNCGLGDLRFQKKGSRSEV